MGGSEDESLRIAADQNIYDESDIYESNMGSVLTTMQPKGFGIDKLRSEYLAQTKPTQGGKVVTTTKAA